MFSFQRGLEAWINQRFHRWLTQKVPTAKQHYLSRKNIFILPSTFGVVYLLFAALLFILGTNYQNNLILLMSFILGSCFISAMLQSFKNLTQLEIKVQQQQFNGFAEEKLSVPITFSAKYARINVQIAFGQQPWLTVDNLGSNEEVNVPVYFEQRGVHRLERLLIQSYFPLGLFKVWTNLDLGVEVIIYPKPIKPPGKFLQQMLTSPIAGSDETDWQSQPIDRPGIDEFQELKRYQAGESLAKVAWKQVARGQAWHTKYYEQHLDVSAHWLSFEILPQASLERRLSWLTFLVLYLEKQDIKFGLALNKAVIAPNGGAAHCQQCLQLLAVYGGSTFGGAND